MSGVIRFDLERQRSFNKRQLHVALSCVTDVKNLHLIGKYNCNVFQVALVILH